jgi:hypothetical protein
MDSHLVSINEEEIAQLNVLLDKVGNEAYG